MHTLDNNIYCTLHTYKLAIAGYMQQCLDNYSPDY